MNIVRPRDRRGNYGKDESSPGSEQCLDGSPDGAAAGDAVPDDAAADANAADTAAAPLVENCYRGFYADFLPEGDDAQKAVSGAGCFIGAKIELELRMVPHGSGGSDHDSKSADSSSRGTRSSNDDGTSDTSEGHREAVLSCNGIELAKLPHRETARIVKLVDAGWNITALLSLVTYSQPQKRFYGEAAFMCSAPDVSPEVSTALREFDRQQTRRIKGGDHPSLALDQHQFEKVVESGGAWYMTSMAQSSKEQRKRTRFKKRQSWSDKLVDASMNHRMGCSVASTLFLVALVAAIAWLVVTFVI